MRKKTKDLKKIIKKHYKLIIVFICLILVMEIIGDLIAKEVMTKDVIGYQIISKYLICDSITPIAKFITNFGGVVFLIASAIFLLIIIKNKTIGRFICLNLALSAGLNQLLKHIVQRPRPTEYRLIDESGYSFPSGHSMVSAAFYGFLIYLIFKNVKNKYIKSISITLLSLLVCLIGISRIYLGVHYTSDVLAGFLISILYLIIFTSIVDNYLEDDKEENQIEDVKRQENELQMQ